MTIKRRFITSGQLTAIVLTLVLSTALLLLPNTLAVKTAQSAWLAPWFALPVAVFVACLVIALHRRYPGQTPVEYAPRILGRPLGKAVGLMYVLFFFHMAATNIQEHSMFLDSTILITTPGAVFYGSLAVLAVYLLWQGLHVLVHLNQLIVPIALATLLVLLLMVSPNMEPGHLAPLVSYGGLPDLLAGSVISAGWLSLVFGLSMLLPYVKPEVRVGRAAVGGLVITTFFLSLLIAGIIAVFNAAETTRLQFPVYSLARFVFIGEFFNRLDPLSVLVWVAAVSVKFGFWFFIAVAGLAQLTGVKSTRGLLPAAAFFVAALSTLLYDNVAQLTTALAEIMPLYFLTVQVGMPTVLFVAAVLRGKEVES
ncbi:MAG: endospore germination permease [Candidatus Desulforudis sp.]|nr:endospore germination permease [Desulforudis sp.]